MVTPPAQRRRVKPGEEAPGGYPIDCYMKGGLILVGRLKMECISWEELEVPPQLSLSELLEQFPDHSTWDIQLGKIWNSLKVNFICQSSSLACGMKLSNSEYIITGGAWTSRTVSRYSRNGWQGNLPSLNLGRQAHGCSSYRNNNRDVLVVFGGGIGTTRTQTSSTETLTLGSSRWVTISSLPRLLWDVKAININNVIYALGKIIFAPIQWALPTY